MIKRVGSWGLVLLLAASAARASDGVDEWRGRFQGDVRTGASHIVTRAVTENGEKLLKTDVTRSFAYFKGGEISWTQFLSVWETPEGAVRRFSLSSTTKDGKTFAEGKVSGGRVKIFFKAPKAEPKEYEKPWEDVCGPAALERKLRSAGFGRSVSYAVRTYSFATLAPITLRLEGRGATSTHTLAGQQVLQTLKVESSLSPGAYYWEFRDSRGRFVQSTTSDGCRIEAAITERQAQARERGVLALYPVTHSVRSPGRIYRARDVEAAVISLELTGQSTFKPISLSGPGQKVTAGGGATRAVTLALRTARPRAKAKRPVTDEKLKPYLQPSYFLDFDADGDRTRKKAERLVRGQADCLAAARKLSAWIAETTAKLPLNDGFSSASVTLARGEGDCSELAVLLCSLARAVGIPARLAGGLALQGQLFLFHVWVEVWCGAWVPLDPTNPDGGFDAFHIRFGETDLNKGVPEFALYGVGSVVRQLRIRSIDYWLGKLKLAPGEVPRSTHAEGGNTYTSRLLGFSMGKPGHWSFTTQLRGITGGLVAAVGRNRQERVLIRPHPAEYFLDYGSLLRRMESTYRVGPPQARTVGGRRAVVVDTADRVSRYCPKTAYVIVGGEVYAVESNDCSPDCKQAFELVLSTLRFQERKG